MEFHNSIVTKNVVKSGISHTSDRLDLTAFSAGYDQLSKVSRTSDEDHHTMRKKKAAKGSIKAFN